MKFITNVLLIALLSFAVCLFMPWWSIAIVGFVVSFAIPQKNGHAFLAGFLALFLLWCGLSFYLSNANDHLFAQKISMLILKSENTPLIIFATGLIGGLVAGFASLSGRLCRKIF